MCGRDTTFKISGVICLLIDIGEHVANVMLEVSPILATKMIFGPDFIDKTVRSIQLGLLSIVPEIGLLGPILASFTDAVTAHIDITETENDKEKAICEAAKMTTITPR